MAERRPKAIGDALILMMPRFYDAETVKVSEGQLAVKNKS
jgi:hypothetical protein